MNIHFNVRRARHSHDFPGSVQLPSRRQVTVLGVEGNQVRIGNQAPDNVQILREETLESDIV